MSELYWIHRVKKFPNVSESEFEQKYNEVVMPMWVKLTGCKNVLLVKAVELPWNPGSKSNEYDYLWITVWDSKEDHHKFIEKGGMNMSSMKTFMDQINELNLGELARSLGSVEIVASVRT